jgi:hypothetical protein
MSMSTISTDPPGAALPPLGHFIHFLLLILPCCAALATALDGLMFFLFFFKGQVDLI